MHAMSMPVAHRASQSGQWQQLQSQWEQQQQQMQQHEQHRHNARHDPYHHTQEQMQHQPYSNDAYYHQQQQQHSHYSHYQAAPTPIIPPLILRIAVSPTQTEDLPIDVAADTDVTAISEHFCRTHNITGDSKLAKLHAMIERSVEQHRQQHATVTPPPQSAAYYAPYAADSAYEQQSYGGGGGYYDEQQAYAEQQYSGQYGMPPSPMTATSPSHQSHTSSPNTDDLSPLQPTFTPSRPTSALSHTSAMHHSPRESNSASSAQQFSHSQPTPSLRPSSLTLPSSHSPSPRAFSSTTSRPISPHTAGYLNAPASARLYANAAVKQRQLQRHQQQKQQLELDKQYEELQHCTFTPLLHNNKHNTQHSSTTAADRRRDGRRQYQWIEDWNGAKRDKRLAKQREVEQKRVLDEQCSFTPTVNAVSHQLAQTKQKHNPNKQTTTNNKSKTKEENDKAAKQQQQQQPMRALDKEAKAKITQFLQRTIERQQAQKQALAQLTQDNIQKQTPTFAPTITTKAQATQPAYNKPTQTATTSDADSAAATGSGVVSGVVSASVKKRQRKCDEVYRVFAARDGYIDRSAWVKLVKTWYLRGSVGGSGGSGSTAGGTGGLERMRWELDMDDVAVIQMVIRECDRQMRRDRKLAAAGKRVDGTEGDSVDEWTWQLSLADFYLWMERLWRVVVERAKTAEREEERMIHKFTPTHDPGGE